MDIEKTSGCRGLTRAIYILSIEHLRMLHCRRTLYAKSHLNGALVAIRNLSLCCYSSPPSRRWGIVAECDSDACSVRVEIRMHAAAWECCHSESQLVLLQGQAAQFNIRTILFLERTSAQPQVNLSLFIVQLMTIFALVLYCEAPFFQIIWRSVCVISRTPESWRCSLSWMINTFFFNRADTVIWHSVATAGKRRKEQVPILSILRRG